jgi:NADP-dependent 3-hydroxy acid dehydrogenase YdfG
LFFHQIHEIQSYYSFTLNFNNFLSKLSVISKLSQISQEIAGQQFSGTFTAIPCDLRLESDIKAVFDQIKCIFGKLDICINNADLAHNSPLINGNTNEWKELIDVNVLGLSITTREAIRLMLDSDTNDGQIIYLNIMGGHRVLPNSATHFYSATEFSVRALTEGLRQELRQLKSGIRVPQISPGMVENEFALKLHKDEEKAAATYPPIKCLQADDIAQVVIDILQLPNHVEINNVLIRPTQQSN